MKEKINAASVAQLLLEARACGVDRLDAQLLLGHVLAQSRSWLIAHDDATVGTAQATQFRSDLARRAADEPLAYVLGEQEFHGLPLQITPQVLIPRSDTEVLVDWAIELLRGGDTHSSVLDLGTGSGAIALALAQACPAADVCAVDVSSAALDVARANGQRLHLKVQWLQSDWWSAVGSRRFDLIVSNPPYIAEGDPHLVGLRHEPLMALTPGSDGLSALRIIAQGAREHLLPQGWLLLEHGFDQAQSVRDLLRSQGFKDIQTRLDLAGHPRCIGARL